MSTLHDGYRIRSLSLSNRLVIAPMVSGFAIHDAPSEASHGWYGTLAASGAGLVVVEACPVRSDGLLLPFMMGLWDDSQIEGMAALARTLHQRGMPAVCQIVHGGARSWQPDVNIPRPGPSAVAVASGPAPQAMDEAAIQAMIEAFVQSAKRVKAAGFDGVEIHGAHYYLISQFLSPYTNTRQDAWGGNVEKRARFALEIVRRVRDAVGPDFPLFFRMHAEERFAEGVSLEELIYIAQSLEKAGVDVLDLSAIGQASWGQWEGQRFLQTISVLPKSAPAGDLLPAMAQIKASVNIPTIAVGKLGDLAVAEKAVASGQADLIALARQVIADPQTPRKWLEGDGANIQRCEECLACFAAIRKGGVKCPVNPALR